MSVRTIAQYFLFLLIFSFFGLFVSLQHANASSMRMYVSNNNDNTISVIDAATDTVIATIPVGNQPRAILGYAPDNTIYVANTYGDSVSVINALNNTVVATISVPDSNILFMALNSNGTRLYGSDFGPSNRVIVMDTTTNSVLTTISGLSNPEGIAVTPDDAYLYVVNTGGDSVSVFDTTTYSLVATIPVGQSPTGIAIKPDGSRAYVTTQCTPSDCLGNTVSVIDTATKTVVDTITVGINPYTIAINPAGTRAYTSNTYYHAGGSSHSVNGNVSVIDLTTDTVIATPSVGFVPDRLGVSPDGSKVYVGNTGEIGSGTVSVIDANTNNVINTVTVGAAPEGVAGMIVDPSNSLSALTPAKVWVGLKNSDDVGVKFDLRAEVYKNSFLVASGQLNSFSGGSSGFNNAHLATIPFDSFSSVGFSSGSALRLKVLVRNACTGSGHNSGTARLWYNDSAANSQFGATIHDTSSNYFLRDGFVLATTAGPGPKKTIDVQSGAKCSAFKTFGTWAITP